MALWGTDPRRKTPQDKQATSTSTKPELKPATSLACHPVKELAVHDEER
jgi:hypothetical protein